MADPKQLTPEEKQKANKGCLTILLVAAVIFGVWYFTKSNDKKEESTTQYVQLESSSSASTAPSTQSSSSSSSSSSIADKDPYEVIHIAFEGFPDKEDVQPMLEAVMKRYNMTVTNDNIIKVGNMLVTLKQDSKVGVTEMEILKHIYQKGSSSITLPEQAGISSVLLEQSK